MVAVVVAADVVDVVAVECNEFLRNPSKIFDIILTSCRQFF